MVKVAIIHKDYSNVLKSAIGYANNLANFYKQEMLKEGNKFRK
jgi:hypothetical protein